MNEKFLKVEDVMQILGISKSAAYKIMRQMNDELVKKGYAVIRGKISRKYFEERFYGMTEEV
ncbi:MAG: AlpA family phage regulatory protein [Eubacterium sp.]